MNRSLIYKYYNGSETKSWKLNLDSWSQIDWIFFTKCSYYYKIFTPWKKKISLLTSLQFEIKGGLFRLEKCPLRFKGITSNENGFLRNRQLPPSPSFKMSRSLIYKYSQRQRNQNLKIKFRQLKSSRLDFFFYKMFIFSKNI